MTGGNLPRLSGTGICDRHLWYAQEHAAASSQTGTLMLTRHTDRAGGTERVTCLSAFLSHTCCANSRCVPAPGFSHGLETFVSLSPHVLPGQTQAPGLTLALFHFLLLERLIWKLGAATLCCGAP